jgi:hypothetical protein
MSSCKSRMNKLQAFAGFPRPIHAAVISKTTLCGSFLNEKLHICPLIQSENRPHEGRKGGSTQSHGLNTYSAILLQK